MSLDLDLYEAALIQRLEPLRIALADVGIPVALLPRKAYALGELEEKGHIAIAFPDSEGDLDRTDPSPKQLASVYVEIRISLTLRYNLDPSQVEATITWSLDEIVGLLVFYKLPVERVKNHLLFVRHQLYKPEDDRWEAMARFTFDVWIVSTGVITTDPPIKQVVARDDQGNMFIVE